MAIIPLLTLIISNIPALVSAGMDAYDLWSKVDAVISENKVVGDPEWEALDDLRNTRKAEFDAAVTARR
jgi:hypothetical protein